MDIKSVRKLRRIWSMTTTTNRCLPNLRLIFCRDGGIIGIRKLKSKTVMIPRRNRMKVTSMMKDPNWMKKRKKYPMNMVKIMMNTIVKTLFAATTRTISMSTKTSLWRRSWICS